MKFRKKPVVIEAVQFNGQNEDTIRAFVGGGAGPEVHFIASGPYLDLWTLEGPIRASRGDWIIRGVKGEFYPCKPDIFLQTYEPVEERTHE